VRNSTNYVSYYRNWCSQRRLSRCCRCHGGCSGAKTFDPDRFLGARPGTFSWIPFGGGTRRCIGANFATLEMNVVLRTLLRDFTLEPTDGLGERYQFRGVAMAPAGKGRAVVYRRTAGPVTVARPGAAEVTA
jgi:hypothetical protein